MNTDTALFAMRSSEMTGNCVTATLDKRYSSETATARTWEEGRSLLEKAEIYWLTTVRADGRPNASPLTAIWLDGAIHFCTGENERKALNIVSNRQCAITTGCNAMNEGFDIVIEGDAVRVLDAVKLQRVADTYGDKYAGWGLTVGEGVLLGEGGDTLVFEIVPGKAFGFGKGEPFSQTRWDF
jgi:general stress protein 26